MPESLKTASIPETLTPQPAAAPEPMSEMSDIDLQADLPFMPKTGFTEPLTTEAIDNILGATKAPEGPAAPAAPVEELSLDAFENFEPRPHLVREKTGEKIYITKDEFKIGKSKIHADYPIENNGAISRVHIVIIRRNGVCYIEDNNSTNGTFVNGTRLEPGREMLLKANTHIILGDEGFMYRLKDDEV